MDKASRATEAQAEPALTADPMPFGPPTYLFHLLVVINRQRDLRLEELLGAIGLTVARYRAIGVIARLEPCAMSELADFSVVERTTMTRIVDQLVADGLAERKSTSADRRKVLLTLTAAGRALYDRAVQVLVDLNEAMAAGLSDAEQMAVIQAEETVLHNLVRAPGLAERLMYYRRDASES